jgi:hypothetical protein
MKNKYKKQSHISVKKIGKIIACFVEDLPATKTAEITHLNRNTINKYFVLLSLMTRILGLKEVVGLRVKRLYLVF